MITSKRKFMEIDYLNLSSNMKAFTRTNLLTVRLRLVDAKMLDCSDWSEAYNKRN